MTDYTKNNDYSDKDALAAGDPEKLILGSDLDSELDEIQTVIATKYDVSDIATQAQAEAGVSNAVLMTPLRVAQLLSGAFGATGAGMLADIAALADPNADRFLFWDDSAGAVALGQFSTGLTISGTVLTTNDSQIVHDSLSGYDANRHVDHTAVSILAGTGLSGGGTLAASRTLTLDISSLTTDASPDTSADYFVFHDTSEGVANKILMNALVGTALGDGAFYLSSSMALSTTAATIVWNGTEYNSLTRGTYDTGTGIYTAGASGARIMVMATCYTPLISTKNVFTLFVVQSGTGKGRVYGRNDLGSTTSSTSAQICVTLSLTAGQTCYIQASMYSGSSTLSSGADLNRMSIVELA